MPAGVERLLLGPWLLLSTASDRQCLDFPDKGKKRLRRRRKGYVHQISAKVVPA